MVTGMVIWKLSVWNALLEVLSPGKTRNSYLFSKYMVFELALYWDKRFGPQHVRACSCGLWCLPSSCCNFLWMLGNLNNQCKCSSGRLQEPANRSPYFPTIFSHHYPYIQTKNSAGLEKFKTQDWIGSIRLLAVLRLTCGGWFTLHFKAPHHNPQFSPIWQPVFVLLIIININFLHTQSHARNTVPWQNTLMPVLNFTVNVCIAKPSFFDITIWNLYLSLHFAYKGSDYRTKKSRK